MFGPNPTHVSPMKNWLKTIPQELRIYNTNDDMRINPSELTDRALADIMHLNDESLRMLFYNSTNTIPSIIDKLDKVEGEEKLRAQEVKTFFIEMERHRREMLSHPSSDRSLSDVDAMAERQPMVVKLLGDFYRDCRGYAYPDVKPISDRFAYQPESVYMGPPGYEEIVKTVHSLVETMPDRLSQELGLSKEEVMDAQSRIAVAIVDWTPIYEFKDNKNKDKYPFRCSDVTDVLLDGYSLVVMNNCHGKHVHSHPEDIVHEYTHATLYQLMGGLSADYNPKSRKWVENEGDIPQWIEEGLATYVQGNLAERTAQAFCQEGRAALVSGKCTCREVIDPIDKDNIVKNLILENRNCSQYIGPEHHKPKYCLNGELEKKLEGKLERELDDYGDYAFFGAIFTWLGRENVQFIVSELYKGEYYKDVVRQAVSNKLGFTLSTYESAWWYAKTNGVREMVRQLDLLER